MSCILVMTFSGSMMLFMYLILKYLLGSRFSASWRYKILKVAMLYYLIPLPFLKPIYEEWFVKLFAQKNGIVYTWSDKNLIMNIGGDLYFNQAFQNKVAWVFIWLSVAMGFMLVQICSYLKNKKRLLLYQKQWKGKCKDEYLESLKTEYCIMRKVCCYECGMEQAAFTIGVVKPIILFCDTGSDEKNQMIISHELIHIKRNDIIWKVLMTFVKIVHWYNPLVWLLSKEIEQTCEMACDEIVVHNKTEEQRRDYARLLLDESIVQDNDKLWKVALSNSGEKVKERMENVMKKGKTVKKWKSCIMMGTLGVMTLMNSLTVLAYDDIQYRVIGEASENVEEFLESDFVFVSDGMEKEETFFTDIIKYDCQFVAEDGNIYPVDEISTIKECSHTYISGQVQNHIKKANGSCSIQYYEAKRCSECGAIVVGKYIMTVDFPVCVH